MNQEIQGSGIKILFGFIIFLFSVALAYFIANYLSDPVRAAGDSTYWITLLVCGGIYILIGLLVVRVFPVSLGFLFSADVLLLHVMFTEFDSIPDELKTGILAIVLAVLYGFASVKLDEDRDSSSTLPGLINQPPTSTPGNPVGPATSTPVPPINYPQQ